MSAYREFETSFNDKDCLVESLKELGYKPRVTAKPAQLTGYQGDKRQNTAEIILPRKQVGSASNDIGFKLQADGTYKAIISDYDKGRDSKFLHRVTAAYAEKKAIAVAQAKGMKFVKRVSTKTAEGERTRLVFKPAVAGR